MSASPAAPTRIRSPQGSEFAILVIEDNQDFGEFFNRYLKVLGFSVMMARTGEEGLLLAQARKPDLIFLDLCLGLKSRLSGNRALRMLKLNEETKNIPVVAMSGIMETPEDDARVRRNGAVEFLVKGEIRADAIGRAAFLRRVSALLILNHEEAIPQPVSSSKTEAPDMRPKDQPGLAFTLLVIDDEEESAELMRLIFSKHPAYKVISANSGAKGLRMAASEIPDLIILDLTMPGMRGQEVCKRLREQEKTFYLPILILTADRRVKQEINCMDLGADDYLVKPADPARMMARIRSLIRRYRFRGNSRGIIKMGAVSLDISTHRVTVGVKTVDLTHLESAILALLMSGEGRSVDKKMLYKKLYHSWPPLNSSIIKAHIRNIREKLGEMRGLIVSHKEQGYRFDVEYADRLDRGHSSQG